MLVQPASSQRRFSGRRSPSADVHLISECNDGAQQSSFDTFSSAAVYTEPPPPYELLSHNRALVPGVVRRATRYTAPHPLLSRVADPFVLPPSAHRVRFERPAAHRRLSLSHLLSSMGPRMHSPPQLPTSQNKFRQQKSHSFRSDLHEEAANVVVAPVMQHPSRNTPVSHPPLTNPCRANRDLYSWSDMDSAQQDPNERSELTRAAGTSFAPPPTTEETNHCHKCHYSFGSSRLLQLHLLLIHGPPSYSHPPSFGRSYYT